MLRLIYDRIIKIYSICELSFCIYDFGHSRPKNKLCSASFRVHPHHILCMCVVHCVLRACNLYCDAANVDSEYLCGSPFRVLFPFYFLYAVQIVIFVCIHYPYALAWTLQASKASPTK